MELERKGVPVATLISTPFVELVKFEAATFGFRNYQITEVPHPFGDRTAAWVANVAVAVLGQVIEALTSQSEKNS